MITPEPMVKVVVTTTKQLMPKVIEKFYGLRVLHISEHEKTQELDIGSPLGEAERISAILLRLRAVKALLNINGTKTDYEKVMKSLGKLSVLIEELNVHVNEKKNLIKKCESGIADLTSEKAALHALKKLNIPAKILGEYRTIEFVVGRAKSVNIDPSIPHEISTYDDNGKLLFAVFFRKEDKQRLLGCIKDIGEIKIAATIKGDYDDGISKAERKIHKLQREMDAALKDIEDIRKNWDIFLKTNEENLQSQLEKLEAPLKFAATKGALIAQGFIPESRYAAVESELNRHLKGRILVEKVSVKKGEKIPVKLRNSKIIRPFEFFLSLYSLPSYKELDPTFMLFITFPIFFGFMLGDVIYGLTLLLLFLYLRKKMHSAKNLINAMIQASLFTMLFGFIFGEYLGFEEIGHFKFPHLLSRVEGSISIGGNEIPAVLVIGVLIGFVHVNIGFILGFINEMKSHSIGKAINAKLSWIIFEIGLALLVMSLLKEISIHYAVGAVVMAGAVVMLAIGEGVQGPIELPTMFSNMLSYSRLGAVGLSSVYLALVINEHFVAPLVAKGGIFILFAVLIATVGHAINIALGIIGPFLHAVRLHYVEFFSKFFHGSGLPYTPFGEKKTEV